MLIDSVSCYSDRSTNALLLFIDHLPLPLIKSEVARNRDRHILSHAGASRCKRSECDAQAACDCSSLTRWKSRLVFCSLASASPGRRVGLMSMAFPSRQRCSSEINRNASRLPPSLLLIRVECESKGIVMSEFSGEWRVARLHSIILILRTPYELLSSSASFRARYTPDKSGRVLHRANAYRDASRVPRSLHRRTLILSVGCALRRGGAVTMPWTMQRKSSFRIRK